MRGHRRRAGSWRRRPRARTGRRRRPRGKRPVRGGSPRPRRANGPPRKFVWGCPRPEPRPRTAAPRAALSLSNEYCAEESGTELIKTNIRFFIALQRGARLQQHALLTAASSLRSLSKDHAGQRMGDGGRFRWRRAPLQAAQSAASSRLRSPSSRHTFCRTRGETFEGDGRSELRPCAPKGVRPDPDAPATDTGHGEMHEGGQISGVGQCQKSLRCANHSQQENRRR